MGESRGAYTVWMKRLQGKPQLEDTNVDGRIILK
jgi:hypothetical protein